MKAKEAGSDAPAPAGTAEKEAMLAQAAASLADPDALVLTLDAIVVQEQIRKSFDPAKIEELANDIEAQGQIQPIVVSPIPDQPGKYLLHAGERRYRAKLLLQERDPLKLEHRMIKATKKLVAGEVDRLRVQYAENVHRHGFLPSEEAQALANYKAAHPDKRQSDIAGEFRISEAKLSKYLALAEASADVRAAVDAGDIAFEQWYKNRNKPLAQILAPVAAPAFAAETFDDDSNGAEETPEPSAAGKKTKPTKPAQERQRAEQRVPLTLSNGRDLARILQLLAERHGLAPIDLGAKATKADVTAIIEQRTADVLDALENANA
jgi:ParB/RepB/Spo0J family partition protein